MGIVGEVPEVMSLIVGVTGGLLVTEQLKHFDDRIFDIQNFKSNVTGKIECKYFLELYCASTYWAWTWDEDF